MTQQTDSDAKDLGRASDDAIDHRCKCCGQIVRARLRKKCVMCGNEFAKPAIRSHAAFAKQRFCSSACAIAGFARKKEIHCRICGAPQKPHGARGLCARHYMAWRRDDGKAKLDDYYLKHAFRLPSNAPQNILALARNIVLMKRELTR